MLFFVETLSVDFLVVEHIVDVLFVFTLAFGRPVAEVVFAVVESFQSLLILFLR